MSFTIENGVAMPSHRNRYPFDQMQPGQSFEILGTQESRKVRNAAYQYSKKVNKELGLEKGSPGYVAFALRKVTETEDGTKVFRLWRE